MAESVNKQAGTHWQCWAMLTVYHKVGEFVLWWDDVSRHINKAESHQWTTHCSGSPQCWSRPSMFCLTSSFLWFSWIISAFIRQLFYSFKPHFQIGHIYGDGRVGGLRRFGVDVLLLFVVIKGGSFVLKQPMMSESGSVRDRGMEYAAFTFTANSCGCQSPWTRK